jgi:hypothetical protein
LNGPRAGKKSRFAPSPYIGCLKILSPPLVWPNWLARN